MFEGHDPYLVALSVVIAILGGYTGFGLAARIRGTPDASHRLLLAGAAFFLAVGIWTMHFVGMLASPAVRMVGLYKTRLEQADLQALFPEPQNTRLLVLQRLA